MGGPLSHICLFGESAGLEVMEIRSSALVYPGQEVQANQPVLRLGKLDSQVVESRGTQKDIHAHIQQVGGIILAGMSGKVVDITRRGGVNY